MNTKKNTKRQGSSKHEHSIQTVLYWCPDCDVPLLGKQCTCGAEGYEVPLLQPYDIRPVLRHDKEILQSLLAERFAIFELPTILIFNKTSGVDRSELVLAHGKRFGWLNFDPIDRCYSFEPHPDSLAWFAGRIQKSIVDITEYIHTTGRKRLGGKTIPVAYETGDGPVFVRAGKKWGIAVAKNDKLRIKAIFQVAPEYPDEPTWDDAIKCNHDHLKNLERDGVKFIKSWMKRGQPVTVSFSGGKDSTVVLELARRAGVTDVFHVDTGMEFPETEEFVASLGIEQILHGNSFWDELKEYGLPQKDNRWCCERLKLEPAKRWRKGEPGITVQGNRWYESFSRSNLPAAIPNPYDPAQTNISPIRHWRALEVYLYIWWRNLPCNPLYEEGYERIGCWMCPAMLESEAQRTRERYPDRAGRWDDYLRRWSKSNKKSREYIRLGLWRWKDIPPKMRELAKERGISVDPPKKKISANLRRVSKK